MHNTVVTGMTSICLQALGPLATKSIWGAIFNDPENEHFSIGLIHVLSYAN